MEFDFFNGSPSRLFGVDPRGGSKISADPRRKFYFFLAFLVNSGQPPRRHFGSQVNASNPSGHQSSRFVQPWISRSPCYRTNLLICAVEPSIKSLQASFLFRAVSGLLSFLRYSVIVSLAGCAVSCLIKILDSRLCSPSVCAFVAGN